MPCKVSALARARNIFFFFSKLKIGKKVGEVGLSGQEICLRKRTTYVEMITTISKMSIYRPKNKTP